MRMVQWNNSCDCYLLSYEHYHLSNMLSKMGLKKYILPKQLDCRFGPTATVTSLKITWNEGLDQAPQGKRLSS